MSAPAREPYSSGAESLDRVLVLERRLAQRERVLRAVRARERRLRNAFDVADDALIVLDPHSGRVVEANAQASRLLGYPLDELRALPWSALALGGAAGAPERRRDGSASRIDVRTRSGRRLRAEAVAIGGELDVPEDLWIVRPAPEPQWSGHPAHRLARDLEAAALIQRSLLPPAESAFEGLDVAWRFRPCEQLAGDNLNLVRLDGENVGLYVLDVSGHGVPAAMLAVAVHRALSVSAEQSSLLRQRRRRAHGYRVVTPARVLTQLNRDFAGHLFPGQYFTILYGVLHVPSGRLRFASAGHWGPVHVRREGIAELLHARGFPIGVFDETSYEEHETVLAMGDRLVLYSDGVPEAMSPGGDLFDYPRLVEALDGARDRALPAALDLLLRRVEEWVGGPALQDDVSLLAIERRDGRLAATHP